MSYFQHKSLQEFEGKTNFWGLEKFNKSIFLNFKGPHSTKLFQW